MNTRNTSNWVGGLVLIGLGLVFLLQNLTGAQWGNWWAIFILIPAFWAFFEAYQVAQSEGHWSQRAIGIAIGGLVPLVIALVFLFNMNWGKIWPVFLILAGLGAIYERGKQKPST